MHLHRLITWLEKEERTGHRRGTFCAKHSPLRTTTSRTGCQNAVENCLFNVLSYNNII